MVFENAIPLDSGFCGRGSPACVPKTTHSPVLRFRALLGEGIPEVELALT
jgi:hypothetical protein